MGTRLSDALDQLGSWAISEWNSSFKRRSFASIKPLTINSKFSSSIQNDINLFDLKIEIKVKMEFTWWSVGDAENPAMEEANKRNATKKRNRAIFQLIKLLPIEGRRIEHSRKQLCDCRLSPSPLGRVYFYISQSHYLTIQKITERR